MLPRPVAVVIALALTMVVLANVGLQAFGLGDTAIYVMYPAVLGALGLTTKRAEEEAPPTPDTGTPGVGSSEQAPPPTPIESRAARHRHRETP